MKNKVRNDGWRPIDTAPRDGSSVWVSAGGAVFNRGATLEVVARYVKFGMPPGMFEIAADLIEESNAYNKSELLHYLHRIAEHKGWEPIDNTGAEYCGAQWWRPLTA